VRVSHCWRETKPSDWKDIVYQLMCKHSVFGFKRVCGSQDGKWCRCNVVGMSLVWYVVGL
jgi:hypothetical protein